MSIIGDVYFSDKLEEVMHIDMTKTKGGSIPCILHLIWFGEMKQYVEDNLNRWKELMPHWTTKLWTDNDLAVFPSEVVCKVREATNYAQKSDILRMFILKKYGGVYVDTDITPRSSLDPIIALNYDIVLFHEREIEWEYITQFFIAAIPNHPAIKTACHMALEAVINTSDIHQKTGPQLWGMAIANAIMTPKKYGVLQYDTFLGAGIFGLHEYTHSWKAMQKL